MGDGLQGLLPIVSRLRGEDYFKSHLDSIIQSQQEYLRLASEDDKDSTSNSPRENDAGSSTMSKEQELRQRLLSSEKTNDAENPDDSFFAAVRAPDCEPLERLTSEKLPACPSLHSDLGGASLGSLRPRTNARAEGAEEQKTEASGDDIPGRATAYNRALTEEPAFHDPAAFSAMCHYFGVFQSDTFLPRCDLSREDRYDRLREAQNNRYGSMLHDRGVKRLHAGNLAGALHDLSQAVYVSPHRADALIARGACYVKMGGRLDDAAADFGRALQLDGTSRVAQEYLGAVQRRQREERAGKDRGEARSAGKSSTHGRRRAGREKKRRRRTEG